MKKDLKKDVVTANARITSRFEKEFLKAKQL